MSARESIAVQSGAYAVIVTGLATGILMTATAVASLQVVPHLLAWPLLGGGVAALLRTRHWRSAPRGTGNRWLFAAASVGAVAGMVLLLIVLPTYYGLQVIDATSEAARNQPLSASSFLPTQVVVNYVIIALVLPVPASVGGLVAHGLVWLGARGARMRLRT